MKSWKPVAAVAATLIVVAGVGLVFAPFVFAELFPVLSRLGLPAKPPALIKSAPPAGPAAGTLIDGYWRVQKIAPDTFAIGEPEGDLDNYEYLLVGETRALLIDAGATMRDIYPALAQLTSLPVTVIPTHLHFDHTNGLRYFHSIALIDLPETRSRVNADGMVHLARYDYLRAFTPQDAPVFRVTEWVRPDSYIDLGGRRVQVLWTPGHTATSISVYDHPAKLIFTGDLIYPTSLYAFQPDASLSAYEETMARLLAILPPEVTIFGAHCCRNDVPAQAPWLEVIDLEDVKRTVESIENGTANGSGFILRRFPVNSRITMITLYPFGNH
jgi:glyoxylase-like metal-dependent hydrolase (beta-lactamase superfamily II)